MKAALQKLCVFTDLRPVDWESKAEWHESAQMFKKKDISGGLGFVEVTEVMLRSVLSSTGQIKNNSPPAMD